MPTQEDCANCSSNNCSSCRSSSGGGSGYGSESNAGNIFAIIVVCILLFAVICAKHETGYKKVDQQNSYQGQ